jgi:nucleoside-diphosphate-sugar epimerase
MLGVDGVFHLAAWYKVGHKSRGIADKINIGGTQKVLLAMNELKIPRGVYTSTLAVFSDTKGQLVDENYRFQGKHLSEYDRTKWEAHYSVAEPMIKEGLPLIIVLPGLVYGPGDTSQMGEVLKQYLDKKLPMVPQKSAYCWGHVDDIVSGHILAMEKGRVGESYIIAGHPHSFLEALKIAEKISNVKVPRMKINLGILKMMSWIMKVVGLIIPVPPNYRAESLRVTAGVTYLGDNGKAKKELGYSVRPLEEGLRETLEYLQRKYS